MDARHNFPPPRTVQELFCLKGQVAVVTGGAGRYGSGIVWGLAEAGAKVIIASRGLEKCEETAEEVRSKSYDAVARQLDLTCEDSIAQLTGWVEADLGRLDILFNNAVSRSTGGDFDTVSAEQWAETLPVNSTSLLLSTRYCAEIMKKQHRGSIVNISSIYGMVGPQFDIYNGTEMKNPAEYAYTKGGMIQLTRYLACFYAPHGIRVNCISPGGYFDGQPEPFVDAYCARTPLGRMAGPEDIKGLSAFLASDASAYITGVNIPLEGGWTAH